MGEVANEEGDGWACLRCGATIKNVTRWEEVEGEKPEIPSEKMAHSGEETIFESTEGSDQEIVTPPDAEIPDDVAQDEESNGQIEDAEEESEEENLFSKR